MQGWNNIYLFCLFRVHKEPFYGIFTICIWDLVIILQVPDQITLWKVFNYFLSPLLTHALAPSILPTNFLVSPLIPISGMLHVLYIHWLICRHSGALLWQWRNCILLIHMIDCFSFFFFGKIISIFNRKELGNMCCCHVTCLFFSSERNWKEMRSICVLISSKLLVISAFQFFFFCLPPLHFMFTCLCIFVFQIMSLVNRT